MDFYEQLEQVKKEQKLSYKYLGNMVQKNPDAMRMSLKRRSLSDLEITKIKKELAKFFIPNTIENAAEQAAHYGTVTNSEILFAINRIGEALINNGAAVSKLLIKTYDKTSDIYKFTQQIDIEDLKKLSNIINNKY